MLAKKENIDAYGEDDPSKKFSFSQKGPPTSASNGGLEEWSSNHNVVFRDIESLVVISLLILFFMSYSLH